jgi:hypothetical protein
MAPSATPTLIELCGAANMHAQILIRSTYKPSMETVGN